MNTEFEAHRSDFPGFPEGPFVLVAGRLESEPDLALSSPKCLVLLRIWAYFPRQVFERLTIGGLTLAQAEASAAVLQSAAKSAGTFVEGLRPRPSGRRCSGHGSRPSRRP